MGWERSEVVMGENKWKKKKGKVLDSLFVCVFEGFGKRELKQQIGRKKRREKKRSEEKRREGKGREEKGRK